MCKILSLHVGLVHTSKKSRRVLMVHAAFCHKSPSVLHILIYTYHGVDDFSQVIYASYVAGCRIMCATCDW